MSDRGQPRTFHKTASTLSKGAKTLPGYYYKSEEIFRTQLGVTSRAYTPCLYASAESLLAEFDREVLKALGQVEFNL